MANVTTTTAIDTFMQSADASAMRTNLGLGDSATKNTGTTAGTVAAGDDSRITGAVQTTRSISTGSGLSGGGDLSANRTLSVSFGSTSGTACQGNDSRLTDSRVPTGAASGDLDGTFPAPTVRRIQGRVVSSAAPTANQVLGWNGTQWVPMTVSGGGAAETFETLVVLFLGPVLTPQNYIVPTGYKWADIFIASGGDGGSGGELRSTSDPLAQSGAAGGTGGSCGVLEIRRNLWVSNATLKMYLGDGGAGGIGGFGADVLSFDVGDPGQTGGSSWVGFASAPSGNSISGGWRIANAVRTGNGRQVPVFSASSGGAANQEGQTPTVAQWGTLEPALILQPGSGGGGSGNGFVPIVSGGRAADALQMLYDVNTGFDIDVHGRLGFIDATAIPLNTANSHGFFGAFFGGAGGAGTYCDVNNLNYRGGDGAAGMPGCGGGGGGGFLFDPAAGGTLSELRGGNGAAGGPGFLLMFLRK